MADRNALANGLLNYMAMPEGSGPVYNALAMPSQSLSAYEPTWRDRIANALMGGQRASPEMSRLVEGLMGSRGLGNTGMGLLDVTPAGVPMQAQEAWRGGDDRALAMAVMPGPKARGVGGMSDDIVKLYHGTTPDGAIGIQQSGRVAGPAYFTPDKNKAGQFGENIIEVNAKKGDLRVDFDLPGGRLLSVDEANAYGKAGGLNTDGWTIDDWIRRGQSVGVDNDLPLR